MTICSLIWRMNYLSFHPSIYLVQYSSWHIVEFNIHEKFDQPMKSILALLPMHFIRRGLDRPIRNSFELVDRIFVNRLFNYHSNIWLRGSRLSCGFYWFFTRCTTKTRNIGIGRRKNWRLASFVSSTKPAQLRLAVIENWLSWMHVMKSWSAAWNISSWSWPASLTTWRVNWRSVCTSLEIHSFIIRLQT